MEEGQAKVRKLEERQSELHAIAEELKGEMKQVDDIATYELNSSITTHGRNPEDKFMNFKPAGAEQQQFTSARAVREGTDGRYDEGSIPGGGYKQKVDTSKFDGLQRTPYGLNSNHLGRGGPVPYKAQIHVDDR